MIRVKLAALLGGTLLATPAFAQDPDPSMEGEYGAEVSGEGAGMEGMATTDTNADVVAGTAFWPQAAVDRPYMRPKGKVTAGLDYGFAKLSVTVGGMTVSGTGDAMALSAAYGITDQISAGLVYAIPLGLADNDFNAAGDLTLWGGYQIAHTPKLSISATVGFGIDLDNTDNMGIAAGLGAKYLLSPKLALFTGAPYGPGLVGDHLQISLADMGPITFDIPIGAMFQATPQLNAFLSTGLATIAISNAGDSAFFGADFIPLTLGALFAVNQNIDVTAAFALADLKDAGFDLYAFSIGARWHQ
jgi:hypothetical protein